MSFDFINGPYYNNGQTPAGVPQPQNFVYPQQQQQEFNTYQYPQQQRPVDPRIYDTPQIISSGRSMFKTIDDNDRGLNIPVEKDIPDEEKNKRKVGRPRKEKTEESTGIIRTNSHDVEVVEDMPTIYTYGETTNLLKDTLAQIDGLNGELAQEFETVRHSRTMKNKYNVLVGLSENIGSLIGNRIAVIKEINASIGKSNELDYKKEKDRRSAAAGVDEDKYIADLYQSFMRNPGNTAPTLQLPQVDSSLFGSGIVRADIKSEDLNNPNGGPVDIGYLNYMSNLSPEQNLMRYEGNPNVKQVVVFDASTGNKFFQYMDLSTMTVIPNMPVYDQMFMEDTTLDVKNKIAKNLNLNETFPIVVINDGVTSQY